MSTENQEPKKPDEPRSPGVTDRDALAPEQPDDENEVVRRPIIPDATDTPAKPDDPRSPGVTDRDISPEEMTASNTEETDTVRRLIVPEEDEPEDPSSSI
jgi:hypothetical protein